MVCSEIWAVSESGTIKSHASTHMSHAHHLGTSKVSFPMLTEAKRLPKNISKENLPSPFFCAYGSSSLNFIWQYFVLSSALNINIYLSLCFAVQNHLKGNSGNHQYCFIIVSIQFFATCFSSTQVQSSSDSCCDWPSEKSFILYISFPVATGYTWESEAGTDWKDHQRMWGRKTSHKTAGHINLSLLRKKN